MLCIITYAWNKRKIAVRPWDGLSINKKWRYKIDSESWKRWRYMQDKQGHIYYKTSAGDWCKWCNNFDLDRHLQRLYQVNSETVESMRRRARQ